MLRNTKIIIAALGLLILVMLFMVLQTYSAQKRAEAQRDKNAKTIDTQKQQLADFFEQNNSLKKNLDALSRDITQLKSEKDTLTARYETVNKEKESLLDKLEELKTQLAAKKEEPAPEAQKQTTSFISAGDEAYWAGIIKAKTDLELQLGNVRNELKNMQINNEQLLREKSSLELDVKNFTRQTEELKQQADYSQKVIDSLSAELVREKNNKMHIDDTAKTVKSENITLRRQLRALSDRKIELERKLSELQTKSKNAEDSYAKLETILKDKLMQVDDLKRQVGFDAPAGAAMAKNESPASVELSPIVVRPVEETLTAQSVSPAVGSGEIMLVNRENNFVIINAGDEKGIKVGDSLPVYRGDKEIATVEAIQIRKNFTACDIKRESTPIKVGDNIK